MSQLQRQLTSGAVVWFFWITFNNVLAASLVVVQDESWGPLAELHQDVAQGLLIDRWQAIADEMGVEPAFEWRDHVGSLLRIEQGPGRVHGGTYYVGDQLHYSMPLFTLKTSLFTHAHIAPVHSIGEFYGSSVGVIAGHPAQAFLAQYHPRMKLRLYLNSEQLLQALFNEDVAAIALEVFHAQKMLQRMSNKAAIIERALLYEKPIFAAVHPDDEDLLGAINSALSRLPVPPSEFITPIRSTSLNQTPLFLQWFERSALFILIIISLLLFCSYRTVKRKYRKTQDALVAQRTQFTLLTHHMSDWMWEINNHRCFTYSSASVEKILGHSAKDLIGRSLESLFKPEDIDRIRGYITHLVSAAKRGEISETKDIVIELPMLNIDLKIVWTEAAARLFFDRAGNFTHAFASTRDITERRQAERRLKQITFNDPLTALPNRRLVLDRLRHAIAAAARHLQYSALFYVDIDNFKRINDSFGQDSGDLILQQVAERLSATLRESDTVGRLGGDEFIILSEYLATDYSEARQNALRIAIKVLEMFDQDFILAGHSCHLSASIGIVLFNSDKGSPEQLIKHADLAMCQAKLSGRNQFYLAGDVLV